MSRRRVGVLMGGCSAERDVSLRTGDGVAAALESRGHDVKRIVWSDDGAGLDERVRAAEVDVVFLALHGRGGEDGCVQGLLELMGIPYTGSGRPRERARHGQAQGQGAVPAPQRPDAAVLRRGARRTSADLEELHGNFGFPAIVKPRREGSSVGLAKVDNLAELAEAVEKALAFDEHVARRALREGDRGARRHPRRPRARRDRGRGRSTASTTTARSTRPA